MSRCALITGVSGFTGKYMAAELAHAGYEVFGLTLHGKTPDISGVQKIYACDLSDISRLACVVEEVRPEVVVHLAGISFVAHLDAELIYRVNLVGSRNLLEVLSRATFPLESVLLASSAHVYGNGVEGGILAETTPFAPNSDYSVSKVAMEYVAKIYEKRIPIVIARAFNYTGVGQSENFLLPKIVSHIRQRAAFIELGNIDAGRDLSDVRFVVKSYKMLLESPAAIGDVFNICSGKAYTVREILGMAQEISDHAMEVRVNPQFVRANEIKMLLGSKKKFEAIAGKANDIPLKETVRWMIEVP